MTHTGMSYEKWRAQYGNPLGLTHDNASRAVIIRHILSAARDGMRGHGAGASGNFPVVPIKKLPKIGDINKSFDSNLELYALYFGADDDDWYVTHEGDRSPSLSYYYRNREKVKEYQARYRARKRNS